MSNEEILKKKYNNFVKNLNKDLLQYSITIYRHWDWDKNNFEPKYLRKKDLNKPFWFKKCIHESDTIIIEKDENGIPKIKIIPITIENDLHTSIVSAQKNLKHNCFCQWCLMEINFFDKMINNRIKHQENINLNTTETKKNIG